MTWIFQNNGKSDWPEKVRFIRVQGDDDIKFKPWTSNIGNVKVG